MLVLWETVNHVFFGGFSWCFFFVVVVVVVVVFLGLSLSLLVQVLNTFMTAYIHEKRSLARVICSPTIDY